MRQPGLGCPSQRSSAPTAPPRAAASSLSSVLEKLGNVVIRVETTKTAGHSLLFPGDVLGLGQGDGFSVFAREECRGAELDLSNIP